MTEEEMSYFLNLEPASDTTFLNLEGTSDTTTLVGSNDYLSNCLIPRNCDPVPPQTGTQAASQVSYDQGRLVQLILASSSTALSAEISAHSSA